MTRGRILVGTASWTDKTLLASGWYPPDADDPASRLQYYASQFPLVEVDALKDLDEGVVDQVWARFLDALEPLHEAGRLGSLLFQFPPWFGIRKDNKQYLLECKERCAPYRMCVELRNASWMSEENREETLDFLTSYAVPYVVVDMPQGYRSSIPPVVAATADRAVVRFHGHSDTWESKDIYERFGYLYSEDEMTAWAPNWSSSRSRCRRCTC